MENPTEATAPETAPEPSENLTDLLLTVEDDADAPEEAPEPAEEPSAEADDGDAEEAESDEDGDEEPEEGEESDEDEESEDDESEEEKPEAQKKLSKNAKRRLKMEALQTEAAESKKQVEYVESQWKQAIDYAREAQDAAAARDVEIEHYKEMVAAYQEYTGVELPGQVVENLELRKKLTLAERSKERGQQTVQQVQQSKAESFRRKVASDIVSIADQYGVNPAYLAADVRTAYDEGNFDGRLETIEKLAKLHTGRKKAEAKPLRKAPKKAPAVTKPRAANPSVELKEWDPEGFRNSVMADPNI